MNADDWVDCGCRNLEYPCIHTRAQAAQWLIEHDGTHPGDFIGYHSCIGNQRIDMIRPETGDWRCETCGFVMPLVQGPAVILTESAHPFLPTYTPETHPWSRG